MVGVPALWQALHRKINQPIADAGPLAKRLFDGVVELNRSLRGKTPYGINPGRFLFFPVHGKLGGRMILAAIQVSAALLVGTFLFKMNWGPDFAMILVVLAAWAALCASAGLLLGSIASSEGQVSGLGVLTANGLAALGGCWWPIEITPQWMQIIQKLTPTGWTMDAMHKLISFQSGASSVLPQLALLLIASLAIAALAAKRFQYQ